MITRTRQITDKSGRKLLSRGAWLVLYVLALVSFASAQTREAPTVQHAPAATRQAVASIPFELSSTNHIFFQARVGDSEPLWFVLDSGSSIALIIDDRRAEALKLQRKGKGTISGAGPRDVPYRVHPASSFEAGGFRLDGLALFSMPLAEVEAFCGRLVDGIIGHELFRRYVVEVDYAGGVFRLYEPRGFSYAGGGTQLPLLKEGNHFYVITRVDFPDGKEVEAKLMLDTGAHIAVMLNSPLVNSHDLLRSAPKLIRDPYSPGLGGELSFYAARAKAVRLGELTLRGPVVGLSRDTDGAFADPSFDGVIGGELLRRFKVIFDPSRSRLILEPNGHLAEPYIYATEMSGLGLRAEGTGHAVIRVHSVVTGSPAEKAGLRVGDSIVAVGGRPVSVLKLDGVRRALKEEGREHAVTVERGGARLEFKLSFKDSI